MFINYRLKIFINRLAINKTTIINPICKNGKIKYIVDKEEKVLENQQVIKTPIVRNGKIATIGYTPDVWKKWN